MTDQIHPEGTDRDVLPLAEGADRDLQHQRPGELPRVAAPAQREFAFLGAQQPIDGRRAESADIEVGQDLERRIIPPAGWLLCDGTNQTPDLRDHFIYGTTNIDEVVPVREYPIWTDVGSRGSWSARTEPVTDRESVADSLEMTTPETLLVV